MNCYNCGCELSSNDFCTGCGADVRIYKRILSLSNVFYNEGLRKARVRDLSGAVSSLRQSLKCNKYNTDARNLLGLVYFEMGEAVDAISEWVISKSFQPQKNIADDFLNEVQSNPTKWDTIKTTIKKYNQALEYCRQDSIDLAIIQLKSLLKINPNIVKGHQLLALLYMHDEQWEKARKCLARAQRVDTNNTTTLLYAKEVENALLDPTGDGPDKSLRRKKKDDIITYQSGNDVIIQPLNHPERAGGATFLNIVIGLIIGCAIMWFLVLPSKIKMNQSDVNKELVDVSSQLTEKSASMDELQKRADALEAENVELMGKVSNLTGADGLAEAYDAIMSAAYQYMQSPESVKEIADSISKIDVDYVNGEVSSDAFKSLYTFLYETVCQEASKSYLEDGLSSLKDEKFQDAIDQLTKAFELDSSNAEALFNLAHAYRRNDQISKSKELYKQVISQFADTDYANEAKEYLDGDDVAGDDTAGDNEHEDDGHAADLESVTTETVVPDVTTQNPTETENN